MNSVAEAIVQKRSNAVHAMNRDAQRIVELISQLEDVESNISKTNNVTVQVRNDQDLSGLKRRTAQLEEQIDLKSTILHELAEIRERLPAQQLAAGSSVEMLKLAVPIALELSQAVEKLDQDTKTKFDGKLLRDAQMFKASLGNEYRAITR